MGDLDSSHSRDDKDDGIPDDQDGRDQEYRRADGPRPRRDREDSSEDGETGPHIDFDEDLKVRYG